MGVDQALKAGGEEDRDAAPGLHGSNTYNLDNKRGVT
jgi:hypothetical protein